MSMRTLLVLLLVFGSLTPLPAAAATAACGRHPAARATRFGRAIRLHFDGRGMAWAGIEAGGTGDEVWLDRSWDAGASWPDGSSLGRTSVPAAATGARTTAFATRDP